VGVISRHSGSEEPSFGRSQPSWPERVAWVLERRSVRVALVVVAALFVGLSLYSKFVVEPTLTATHYELSLIGSNDGPTIDVDDQRNLVAVTGAQHAPDQFILEDDRLLIPGRLLEPDSTVGWYSFPTGSVLDDPDLFDPEDLDAALQLRPKQCGMPTPRQDALVQLLLAQRRTVEPDGYIICGAAISGGPSANGVSVRVQERGIRPDEVEVPSAAEVLSVDGLGVRGRALTSAARAAFEGV